MQQNKVSIYNNSDDDPMVQRRTCVDILLLDLDTVRISNHRIVHGKQV